MSCGCRVHSAINKLRYTEDEAGNVRIAGAELLQQSEALSQFVREGGNVLVLDEPTNDLDVGTLRALEEAILGFAGTVLVVSHDRFFLDRVATHILAFEGDSHVEVFNGNWAEYAANRLERGLGDEVSNFKYRKLVEA